MAPTAAMLILPTHLNTCSSPSPSSGSSPGDLFGLIGWVGRCRRQELKQSPVAAADHVSQHQLPQDPLNHTKSGEEEVSRSS
ncbi:unnamed protein product [Linum trigynum]|uniref:Uncharacterized protein n=1 Tax=Linum trigynum TaxID=586398 RepID=A0AAV2EVI7_9ROSI